MCNLYFSFDLLGIFSWFFLGGLFGGFFRWFFCHPFRSFTVSDVLSQNSNDSFAYFAMSLDCFLNHKLIIAWNVFKVNSNQDNWMKGQRHLSKTHLYPQTGNRQLNNWCAVVWEQDCGGMALAKTWWYLREPFHWHQNPFSKVHCHYWSA